MPEGDTILSIAGRLRPVLVGKPLEKIETPQRRHALDRWPEKLAGARIRAIDTHGKHLFLRWDNGLTIHSHLRMSGRWRIFERPFDVGRAGPRGVARARDRGPHRRAVPRPDPGADPRQPPAATTPTCGGWGPTSSPRSSTGRRSSCGCASDDPTRPVADALLDQRTLAGIGNLWKNESLYQCQIDPWRPMADVSDEELERVVRTAREMMLREVRHGGRLAGGEVFEQGGKRCRALRNDDPRRGPVGREPHDLLVPDTARPRLGRMRSTADGSIAAALEISALTKRYDDGTLALDSLDLTIPDGAFFGLLGPNGAGKTTLINSVTGLVRVTSGSIRVFGHEALGNGIEVLAGARRSSASPRRT